MRGLPMRAPSADAGVRTRRTAAVPSRRVQIAMNSLAVKTILVTGATDGLGRGVAERLAADGNAVHLHGRSADKLDEVSEAIRAATGNGRIVTHVADLASLE